MSVDRKKIAKNTLILYFRQILVLVVGLYTSRVILQSLGVVDYGIYGIVGGVVGFLGFLNSTLATSSSRFITYALGEGDLEKSKKTFSTTLIVHVLLGLFVLIVGEVVGIYMINNHLNIPIERISSALIAFQFSIFTTMIGISQVPYSACMVAHEDFSLVAYMAIWDVIARLLIASGLMIYGGDRLILFSGLLFGNSVGVMMFYRFYCSYKYKEAKVKLSFDKSIFRKIASFSGWNLIYQFAYTLNSGGTTVLIGMFFNPVVVAAKTISVKVNSMTTQFIGQFRSASAPQIVKSYAQHDIAAYKDLLLSSGKYSFYIMWVMTLPICLLCAPLLKIWLGDVPGYTIIFVQLIMIDSLFWLFDVSFNQGIVATGNMRKNAIYSSVANLLRFPIVYIFFKLGFSPISSFVVSIVFGAIIGCVIKPLIIIQLVHGFRYMDFVRVYIKCWMIAFISSIVPYLVLHLTGDISCLRNFLMVGLVSVMSVILSIYWLGIDKLMRNKVNSFFMSKIRNKYR